MEWKNCEVEGYRVSSDGCIQNVKTNKIMNPTLAANGHMYMCLAGKYARVARFVAKVFVPNPNGFKTVIHKDGDKHNVSADNLEWTNTVKNTKRKPQEEYMFVQIFNSDDIFISSFVGIPKVVKWARSTIPQHCKGKNVADEIKNAFSSNILFGGFRFYIKSSKDIPKETWKDVQWDGFTIQASSFGRIMRPSGTATYGHARQDGYLAFRIQTYTKSHRIIASAFHGPIPEKHVVNHKNGIKHDNRPENLEITTQQRNCAHSTQTGLSNTSMGPRINVLNHFTGHHFVITGTGNASALTGIHRRELSTLWNTMPVITKHGYSLWPQEYPKKRKIDSV
jgi:hypothetical protein